MEHAQEEAEEVERAAAVEAELEAAREVRQRERLGGGPQRVDQRRRRDEREVRRRDALEGVVQVPRRHVLRRGGLAPRVQQPRRHPQRPRHGGESGSGRAGAPSELREDAAANWAVGLDGLGMRRWGSSLLGPPKGFVAESIVFSGEVGLAVDENSNDPRNQTFSSGAGILCCCCVDRLHLLLLFVRPLWSYTQPRT